MSKVLWLAGGGVTAWGATQITRGVELDGPVGRQAVVVLVLLAVMKLSQLPFWAWKHGTPHLLRARGVRRYAGTASCTLVLGMLTTGLVLGPALWWLTETVCELLGLPLRISGFWPFVVAPLVDLVLTVALKMLTDSFTRKGRSEGSVRRLGCLTVCFGILWFLTAEFDAIRLGADQWWRSVLTMVVLAALFSLAGAGSTVYSDYGWSDLRRMMLAGLPFLALFGVVTNALLLWLVSWFSTGMRPMLDIAGSGTFLLAGLIATAVMWAANLPVFLYGLRRRGLSLRASDDGYGSHPPATVRANGFGYVWVQTPDSVETA